MRSVRSKLKKTFGVDFQAALLLASRVPNVSHIAALVVVFAIKLETPATNYDHMA